MPSPSSATFGPPPTNTGSLGARCLKTNLRPQRFAVLPPVAPFQSRTILLSEPTLSYPLSGGLVQSITLPDALEKESIAVEIMEPLSPTSDPIDFSVFLVCLRRLLPMADVSILPLSSHLNLQFRRAPRIAWLQLFRQYCLSSKSSKSLSESYSGSDDGHIIDSTWTGSRRLQPCGSKTHPSSSSSGSGWNPSLEAVDRRSSI